MPDEINISGTMYNLKEFMFHPELVVKHGMRNFVDSLSKQRAGLVSSLSLSLVMSVNLNVNFFIHMINCYLPKKKPFSHSNLLLIRYQCS